MICDIGLGSDNEDDHDVLTSSSVCDIDIPHEDSADSPNKPNNPTKDLEKQHEIKLDKLNNPDNPNSPSSPSSPVSGDSPAVSPSYLW